VGRKLRNVVKRWTLTTEARRLKSVERLIVAQVMCKRNVAEDVAVVPRDAEDRGPSTLGLDRNQCAVVGLASAKKGEYLGFVGLQLIL